MTNAVPKNIAGSAFALEEYGLQIAVFIGLSSFQCGAGCIRCQSESVQVPTQRDTLLQKPVVETCQFDAITRYSHIHRLVNNGDDA